MSEYITMRDCLKLDLSDAIAQRDQARNLADAAMWEADRLRSQLWRARDRAWQIACERSRLKSQISNLQSP